MEHVDEIRRKTETIMAHLEQLDNIELPALREVLQHVASSTRENNYYTKHSAHTKTSTKGCVMGCLGG